MARKHCAACDLQVCCSFIGMIDIMVTVILGIILLQYGYDSLYAMSQSQGHTKTGGHVVTVLNFGIFLVLLTAELAMGLILKIGADFKDVGKCKAWFFFSFATTITSTFVFLILISMASFSDQTELVLTGCNFAYNLISLWAVHMFIKKLKANPRPSEDGGGYEEVQVEAEAPAQEVV